jgi:uncharacterized lipoprotein YddW (UPF0748 family)
MILMMLAATMTMRCAAAEAEAAPARETRAVWLWGSVVRTEGAEKVAETLAKNNINVALMLVKGEAGTAAWDSKVALAKSPGDDVLKAMAAACKKRGIDLHAWFVFNGDRAWTNQHPADAYMHCGNKSNPDIHTPKDMFRVCPLSEGYQKYFLGLIREIIEQPEPYPLAGIHLDYIRYPHMSYCFCPRHQAKAKELGINLDHVREAIQKTLIGGDKEYYFNLVKRGTDPDVNKWVTLRQDDITNIVKQVREMMNQVDPKLQLSASFMPEGGEKDDTFGIAHYAQNYQRLGYYMDFICPMTYHRQFKKPASWPAEIALNAQKKSGTTVFAGFADAEDMEEVISTARRKGLHGFAFFRYATLKPADLQKLSSLTGIPARPWHELSAPVRTQK